MKRDEGMALAHAQQMVVARVELLAPACEWTGMQQRPATEGPAQRHRDRSHAQVGVL